MTKKASYGLTNSTEIHGKDTEKQEEFDEPIVKGHVTFRLIMAVTGAVLGSFQFGYGLGVTNNPEKSIKAFMNETEVDRSGSGLSEDTIKNLWSLAVSIYAIGGCFGGFFGGWLAKTFGRKTSLLGNAAYGIVCSALLFARRLDSVFSNGKTSLLGNAAYGIVCSALLFASRRAATYEMFIVGRFMIGIHAGIYTAITPLFLSEISPTHIRGAVGVLHQLAVVTGLLAAQVLGFHAILGDAHLWDVLMGLSAMPCVGQLIILPFCPDSPRFLMISRQDEVACKKALVALRGITDVQDEVDEMKKEMDAQEQKVSILQLFLRPSLRMPITIGIVMQLSQQFGGVNGVFFYSTSLFEETGLSESTATYTTSAVGGIMVVMTLVSVPLMDRAGRRTLHLVGLGGMVVFGVAITLALNLRSEVDAFKYVAVVVTLCYVVFFAIGPGSIPWLIVAELFTHESRPAALSICTLVNWMSSFLVGYIFPFVQEGLKDYTFVPFVVLLSLFFAFTFFKVPETKGKTFEEVTSLWRRDGDVIEVKDQDGGADRRSITEMSQSEGQGRHNEGLTNAGAEYGSTDKALESEQHQNL